MKTDIVHRLLLKICAVLFWREWWHPRRGCTQPTPPSRSKWLRGQSWLASQPPPVLYSHNSPLPGTKRETVSTSSHNLPCKFFFSFLFLPLTICLLLFVLSYVKFEREHQCLQGDTRNPQQFGRCSCQGEKTDEADSKEGESCLFLRVCCMSSGSPFSHFAACNVCSFSVSHSTNIFVSYCLQHHGPAMNYPCVLCLSPPLSSLEPSPRLCTCLWEEQWSQSHRSSDAYVFPVKSAIFPRTQSLAKELATVGQPATLCPYSTSTAKGVATGSRSFFKTYSWQQHHRGRGANKGCISGDLTVSLSANLSHRVWVSTCMLT